MALSDQNLLDLIDHKANLILYPDIHHYKSLDQMLNPYGAAIILFCARPNYGHWCCIFKRTNNLIEFFDPYGSIIDEQLQYINKNYRKKSHQDHTYLTKLMIKSPYELSYNNYPFQHLKDGVKTCGRWVALRLACRNISLNKFAKIFLRPDSDEIATLLTMYINN